MEPAFDRLVDYDRIVRFLLCTNKLIMLVQLKNINCNFGGFQVDAVWSSILKVGGFDFRVIT